MRKYLAFLVLLMLPWVARGQALAEWYYWFDTDAAPREAGTPASRQFQIAADVGHLDWGLHTLYVQVRDTAGVYSAPQGQMFFNIADNMADRLKFHYWFDNDVTMTQHPFGQGNYSIDVTTLISGFHVINYYVTDEKGTMSDIESVGFFRSPVTTNQKLNYWFEGDTLATQTPYTADGFVIDVTRVQEGFNTIYFQMDDNGPAGMEACHFIKIPQTEGVGDMTLLCIIDGKIAGKEQVSAQGGIVTCDMDVTHMEVGLHKAMFQLITPSGAGSSIAETYFIRTLTNDDVASMQCSYLIDGFNHHTQKGTCTNGAFHFDLPVDEMEDGLHRIDYMLVAENGATTTQGSAWFFKTPLGGNAITQYDYWLNGKNDDLHSVKLDEPTDPFQLVKLLPVTAEPIRSACFHFEVKDGQPKIYAKNDIHFRFHDKSGRWVDADKQYVDYNVGEDVNVTKQLTEVYGKETFAVPDSNAIQWYSMVCEKGDSIAIKASQATTIQIFAPSGKEVYNAFGPESMAFGGMHTFENGLYYISVHDVSGNQQNVTLSYQHIEKFCLLSTSSPEFGAFPCFQILTMEGNGFDNLKSVILSNDNYSITTDDVVVDDKSRANAYFLFSGDERYGQYDLLLTFNDGQDSVTVRKEKYVTISKPVLGDIDIKITDPRRVADPYPVYITITNTGNLTYQSIPFSFAIDHIDQMTSVKYLDFTVDCSQEMYDAGAQLSFEYPNFMGNNSKTIVVPTLITELLPGESRTYTIGVKTGNHQLFNVYAWSGTPWSLSTSEVNEYVTHHYYELFGGSPQLGANGRGRVAAPNPFGILNGCEDDPCSMASGIAECGCATNLANGLVFGAHHQYWMNTTYRGRKDWMRQNAPLGENLYEDEIYPERRLPSPADFSWYWLQHCLPGRLGQAVSSYNSHRQMMGNNPCPDPSPHQCNPYNPGDPNEMHGYVSESGSKYIRKEISDISYTIEFENNPELANASAHKIVVCDTLDVNIFDMSTFKPTSMKIGKLSVELDGSQNMVKTIDMRPDIYAIAQLQTETDQITGIVKWTISSLDPMTMEETYDIMQGVLPVNDDGNGIGFLSYNISLRKQFEDGESFDNKAGIVFDFEDAILTPTWTNIIDAVAPTSMVSDLIVRNDSICDLSFEGEDNRSGIWKYTLYVQDGLSAPWREVATDIAPDSIYSFKGFDCINYGFCVLATDSAGNVERKELTAEVVKMTMHPGDVNADGDINVIDFTAIANHIMGSTPASFVVKAADVNEDDEINVMDLTGVANLILFGEVSPNRAQANSRMRRVSDQLTLHVSDCEVMAGEEFTVDIHMDGDADFSAFQFDMTLPEGFHVKMVDGAPCATLSTERTTLADTDFFVSRLSDDGTLRVVGASTRDARIEGKEGCVAHVTLVADEKAPAGDYEVAVSHIVTAYGGTGISLSSTKFVATVGGSTDMNSLIDGTHGSSLYDMVGKKIRKDHERTGLEKGAYINNGKKVIVK